MLAVHARCCAPCAPLSPLYLPVSPYISNIQVLRAMRAKASHAAADGSGRAYTVVQEAAELTALRDN